MKKSLAVFSVFLLFIVESQASFGSFQSQLPSYPQYYSYAPLIFGVWRATFLLSSPDKSSVNCPIAKTPFTFGGELPELSGSQLSHDIEVIKHWLFTDALSDKEQLITEFESLVQQCEEKDIQEPSGNGIELYFFENDHRIKLVAQPLEALSKCQRQNLAITLLDLLIMLIPDTGNPENDDSKQPFDDELIELPFGLFADMDNFYLTELFSSTLLLKKLRKLKQQEERWQQAQETGQIDMTSILKDRIMLVRVESEDLKELLNVQDGNTELLNRLFGLLTSNSNTALPVRQVGGTYSVGSEATPEANENSASQNSDSITTGKPLSSTVTKRINEDDDRSPDGDDKWHSLNATPCARCGTSVCLKYYQQLDDFNTIHSSLKEVIIDCLKRMRENNLQELTPFTNYDNFLKSIKEDMTIPSKTLRDSDYHAILKKAYYFVLNFQRIVDRIVIDNVDVFRAELIDNSHRSTNLFPINFVYFFWFLCINRKTHQNI